MFNHLYIHIPFCINKCAYCAFYSETNFSEIAVDNFLNKLQKELNENRDALSQVKTVYIGGGTPSILSIKQLRKLFGLIYDNLSKKPKEFSIECNPDSLTTEKIQLIAQFANRISLGVQTFNKKLRTTLGRIGDISQFNCITQELQKCNLSNISADLIYSIPNQSMENLKYDLDLLISLDIKHISAYSLTIEENTKLATCAEMQIDDNTSADMFQFITSHLASNNIKQYEISNYANENYKCQHNSGIWHGDTYLGLGPTACSFDGTDRWSEPNSLELWLKNCPKDFDKIPNIDRAKEIFIMGLRTVQGWDKNMFFQTCGINYCDLCKDFNILIEENLIILEKNKIYPTKKGLLFWNNIAEFIL